MNTLYPIQDLRDLLEKTGSLETLVLTANRRIAAKINQAWSLAHRDKVITPLRVRAAEDWVQELWITAQKNGITPPLTLLSDTETLLLWKLAIQQLDHGLLMPADSIAELMANTDNLVRQWQIDYRTLPDDPDSALFKRAMKHFEQFLADTQSITHYRCHRILALCYASKKLKAPGNIILAGFDDITPLLQHLLDSSGSSKEIFTPAIKKTTSCLVAAKDPEQEIYLAAHWALTQLRLREKNSATTSIGIIVPDLNQRHKEIEHILQCVFEPQYALPATARYSTPFNISAADVLSQQPMIATALNLLALNDPDVKLPDLLYLLHSPFWASYSQEHKQRIDAEIILRKNQWEYLTLADFRDSFKTECGILSCLNNFEKMRIKNDSKRLPSEWLDIIQQQLKILCWPGDRRLDSIEYQQFSHFQNSLDRLIRLDDILGKITFEKILDTLKSLCRQTPFHQQTKDSPIQVLGLLEGSGLHFDRLWVCGMSEQAWPPLPAPNPLIPIEIQIKCDMPHSSVVRENRYARAITDRLLQAAENIVISFPQQINDAVQRPSGLFRNVERKNALDLIADDCLQKHPYFSILKTHKQIELKKDNAGPGFIEKKSPGGQQLLKTQAFNPFDAFAKFRLGAKELTEPEPGLPRSVRGILLHSALQFFWKNVSTQAALKSHSKDERAKKIAESVEYALRKIKHPALLIHRFRQIEGRQLVKYLHAWLEEEEKRDSFTVIATEKNITFSISGIELSLTIDRIDQLEDGRLLLIDYKTSSGSLSQKEWSDNRLNEPQLPLYCIATDNTAGISFAHINLDSMKFISIGCEKTIPGIKEKELLSEEEWSVQKNTWEKNLNDLMNEFKSGHATVKYNTANIPEHSKIYFSLNRMPEYSYICDLLEKDFPVESKK